MWDISQMEDVSQIENISQIKKHEPNGGHQLGRKPSFNCFYNSLKWRMTGMMNLHKKITKQPGT
jgi:hypothetical protein